MRKITLFVVLSALAALPVAAQPPVAVLTPGAKAATAPSIILEQILVKVNGDIVTKTDLEARQVAALRQRSQRLPDEELKKAIAEVTPDLLVDAIDELLLIQRGKELGYKVTDEQFARVLENIRKENKLETDEAFTAALKQEGLDLATLRKNLERQMVINQVQQVEVMAKVGVSEEEATRYYAEHKSDFTTPAAITLREMTVTLKTGGTAINVAETEAAQKTAEAALARIKAGEPFEKIVADVSDAPSKANGGLVGPLQPSELAPDIRKLLDPLKPGETTPVFRTAGGFAIVKLESSTASELKTFEAAREEIADKVFAAKRKAEFDRYLKKIRSEAIIEWKNEEMHRLYDARTADAPAAKAPGVG